MRHAAATCFALLLFATCIHAQCSYNGNTFSPPSFGWDGTYQSYGQYVPASPGLTGNRLWQMTLCSTTANGACQTGNIKAPVSYIYELNRNDASPGACDMGLNLFGGWSAAQVMDSSGNKVNSLNGTFTNVKGDRVAVVALICGTNSALIPVSYPNIPSPGWFTFPESTQKVWTWDVVFQTSSMPAGLCGNNPPPPQTPNPAPPQTPMPPGPPGPTSPPGTPSPAGPTSPPGPTDKPSEEEKSSAAAIIFVVLVFVLPVFYVGGTVAFNYFKLGKRGWELAPHPEFWKDFPHLCLDGCRFVKDKFLQLIGKGGSGEEYSKL